MKKYIVYIVYTSLLFIFGGCDVLDKYPLDKPNQDTFWNNASEINGGVVGCCSGSYPSVILSNVNKFWAEK